MPTAYIDSLVAKGKGSKAELEKKWASAKAKAAAAGHADDYDYITGIFKKMINEEKVVANETRRILSFSEYLEQLVEGDE